MQTLPDNIVYTAKLIQDCIDEHATYLDIGKCGLRDEDLVEGSLLGNLLAQCTHLETLILSNLRNENNKVIASQNKFEYNTFEKPIYVISNLTSLKKLVCCGNLGSIWRIDTINFLAPLKNLIDLDFRHNSLHDLDGFENLASLEILNLSHNKIRRIENLDALKKLNSLNLSNNQITEIENLEKLTGLVKLELRNNAIKEIKNLEKLANLNLLNISGNEIEEIKNVSNLKKLKILQLEHNRIKEINNLNDLTKLEILIIGENQINEIKNIDKLTNLLLLYAYQNQIEEIKNLEKLKKLKDLILSDNKIKEIKNLDSLKELLLLEIDGNQIEEIKNLDNLVNLHTLNLSHNQIREIKNLDNLTSLRNLDLSSNEIIIINLPKFILDQADFNLQIHSNKTFERINQIEIPIQGNQLFHIKDWLAKQQSQQKTSFTYPLKVLLLGNHGVGKSSLVNFLTGKTTDGSTHILRIVPYHFTDNDFPNALFFDFGGQDFYHGIYRAFLSGGGLQIILYNATIKQNGLGEDIENKPIYNYNLPYWLGQKNYTETKNNSQAEPYFLIQTYAEENHTDTNELSYKKEDGFKKTFYLSLKKEKDLNAEQQNDIPIFQADKTNFNIHFNHCIKQLAVTGNEPQWFIDFLQFIYTKKQGQYQPSNIAEEVLPHFKIDYEQNKDEQIAILKRYLQQLHISGLVLYYHDIKELEDIVWLNPEALVAHIQTSVLPKEIIQHFNNNGGIDKKIFENLINDNSILAFLKAQKVVYLHKPNVENDTQDEYIIPNYLPIAHHADADYQFITIGIAQPSLILKFKNFIPFGFINQLICFFGQQPDVKKFWRNQLLFTYQQHTSVLIQICYKDLTIRVCVHSSTQQPYPVVNYLFNSLIALYCDVPIITREEEGIPSEDNESRFLGNHGLYYLSNEKKYELYVPDKLTKDIYLSIDNTYFVNYHDLKALPVNETQITAYGLDEHILIDTTKAKTVAAYPFGQIINKTFTKMKKIFISYSKDDLVLVNKFIQHLSVLKREGKIAHWYCTELIAGGDWNEEIQNHFSASDIVCFMVSPNFLKTNYIYEFEVKKAFERKEQDKNFKIVPIILDFCRWTDETEYNLGKFTALPYTAKPVMDFKNQNMAWYIIEACLRLLIDLPKQPTTEDFFNKNDLLPKDVIKIYERIVAGTVDA